MIKLYENKVKIDDVFYAEAVRHDRIYVFNDFKYMNTVRQFGYPYFFYTDKDRDAL